MIRHQMRTTLSLDDDALASARVLARQRGESLGAVISELARKGLHHPFRRAPARHPGATNCCCCRSEPKGPRLIWSS
jgi:hypothetical protein